MLDFATFGHLPAWCASWRKSGDNHSRRRLLCRRRGRVGVTLAEEDDTLAIIPAAYGVFDRPPARVRYADSAQGQTAG